MSGRVLVVGAAPSSVGEAISQRASWMDYVVFNAGISGEAHRLDLVEDHIETIGSVLFDIRPQHVVCTVGKNVPEDQHEEVDPEDWYRTHFETNVTGPMRLLAAWQQNIMSDHLGGKRRAEPSHFVAISSNSARVARSSSAAYCASKAALSQALRVKAREVGGEAFSFMQMAVYGYEPGLVAGTPMTDQTRRDFPGVPLTRMRPPELCEGLPVGDLAQLVVAGLSMGRAMNGMLIPFDAGES